MTLINSLKYSFYVIFHPFKGFWDLKHERKGTVKSAGVLLALLIVVFTLRRQTAGFIFNYQTIQKTNIISEVLNIIIPVFLWCMANFAITTLMDGKGTLSDIFIITLYALVPLILVQIPVWAISHMITLDEKDLIYLIDAISILWSAFLLFIGLKSIHEFSALKTLITVAIAIVGMVVISFFALLFFSLIQQLYNFLLLVYMDIRM